ncbi:MAG: hypothetical protein P8X88_06980 [Gammaproteobacteria bacterium]
MKLVLSTICIALLGLFAYQVMSYPLDGVHTQKSEIDKELSKSIDYQLPQLALLNGIDEYSEIVQRPLFVKDRAAAVSAKAMNNVTTVDELSHLILVGTASSSEVKIAIIADTKAKQMERMKVGETYKQWNIAEVSPDHVVFQNSELEYKLFVTPIDDSQRNKQAKLFSQLNKSKIERTTTTAKSNELNYKTSSSENIAGSGSKKPKQKVAGKIWNYNKNPDHNNVESNTKVDKKPVRKSPIRIPDEEEKDAAYYEAEDFDTSSAINRETTETELSIEDYYDDEDISEEDLKVLEELGVKLFDD